MKTVMIVVNAVHHRVWVKAVAHHVCVTVILRPRPSLTRPVCPWHVILAANCLKDPRNWSIMSNELYDNELSSLSTIPQEGPCGVYLSTWRLLFTCHTSKPSFKQESPPAWTQEAYRPPRSKCSLCPRSGGYPVPGPGGVPCPRSGGVGVPCLRSGGMYPSQVWGGTQSQVQGGYPIPPSRPGMGYPLPLPRPGMGYPPDLRWGNPPARPGMGYPLARLGMGYPPPARLGMGYLP